MAPCPKCSAEVPDGGRFCASCGTPLDPSPAALTATSTPSRLPTAARQAGRDEAGISHPSLDQARFVPGAVLDKRYRIVGLLGRGGMGEVYRAEDLKLGQPVALKFLPEGLERDDQRLSRFLNEVKVARQVSHTNVCRVFDVGETDGQHYISMEYVDGEDLASLLRRIGRLPKDKAVQVARQICAGVAAAHEQQILHRDLKPANVMIDGRGRVKITDFGLAGLADAFGAGEIRSGTPAYMAPEQLAGKEVTFKSDIYALGLVLYELFTGKPAFEASSMTEMARLQSSATPTNPSSHVEGFDPTVEKAILRCLEKDPADRPISALAVAAALPGGDPLAAALAAGETPSPEMVADAGSVGGLGPATVVVFLALILLGLAVRPFVAERVSITGTVPLELPPEVLAAEARKIVEQAGYTEPPVDTEHGFVYDDEYFEHERGRPPEERWKGLDAVRPAPIHYWYRQSPRHLTPTSFATYPSVIPDDPASSVSGMADVRLDPQGRLLRLSIVPPQVDDSEAPGPEPDWSFLFQRAGIDMAGFSPARPSWNPLFECDLRQAWEGAYPDRPDVPIRVEAGAWRGRPVFFEIVTPWKKARRMEEIPWGPGQKAGGIILLTLLFGVLIGGLMLARRNLRLGRGDRRSAFRVAVIVFSGFMIGWVLFAHHEPTFAEIGLFFEALVWQLFFASAVWMVYIALEPYVRRLWPDLIISWNRLLQGRLRDPMIGRDVVIGAMAGLGATFLYQLFFLLPRWTGLPLGQPSLPFLGGLIGMRQSVGALFNLTQAIGETMVYLFLVLLLRVILRRRWAAVSVFVLLMATATALGTGTTVLIAGPLALAYWGLLMLVLVRFGMLAFLAARIFLMPGIFMPFTADPSSWYFGQSLLVSLVFAAIAVYAAYVSLAGRRLFSEEFLEAEAGVEP